MTDIERVKLRPEEIKKSLQEEAKMYSTTTWEPWEEDIIKKFIGKVPMFKIAEKLGRKYGTVKNRALALGLKANRFQFYRRKASVTKKR